MIQATTILQRLYVRLKLRHLQALIALDDFRTMGKAAQALGISQPAMSYLLADLETLLEAQLFLRHSRGVDPTDTALELLPIARRICAATEEGAERVALRQRRDVGLVRVAATAAAVSALLDVVMAPFAEAYPQIQVQVATVLGPTQESAFSGDEFDIICGRQRATIPEDWVFMPCTPDRMVPICGPAHTLALKSSVSLDDLASATWLTNHVSTVAQRMFDDLAARAGWTDLKEVRIVSQIGQVIWTMLRDGKYISLIPRSVAMPWLRSGQLVEVSAELDLPLDPIGFYYRPNAAGSATKTFVAELLRERDSIYS